RRARGRSRRSPAVERRRALFLRLGSGRRVLLGLERRGARGARRSALLARPGAGAAGPEGALMRRVIAVVFATVALASPASAQPSIEGVERSYRQGRFRAVIEAVDRVLTSERLDEATLADLLELAALSHHALGDRGGL